AHSNGLLLELSERLDPAAAQDVTNYSLEQWNYKYAASYGSEDYSARHADAVGHDPVAIASATLLGEGKEVFLEVPGLRPVLQMHLRASLRAADGADFAFDFYPTLNALGPRREVDGATDDAAALAPPPVEAAAPPGRGLIQTLSGPDGAPADVRVVRLAALRVPVGEPPSAFLDPGPFRSVWEGFLRIEEGGRFRFSVSGRGSFRLSLDGALAANGNGEELSRFESEWLRLARGNHRIRLEYDAPSSGDAWARLYWTGLAFAREAVPPTAFRNDPSDASSDAPSLARFERLRAGFALLEEAQCARCHAAPEKALPEVSGAGTSLAAPILDGVGDRLRENWLAKWVEQPRSLRKAAVMPALPASAGGREARDIAAYLASLHRTSASGDREAAGSATNASTSGSEPPRGDAQEGAKLFATIGCTACHIAPAAEPKIDAARLDGERIALRHVAEEWTEEGLVEFLLRPSGWRPSTRMPDFGLAFREARHLATFLLDGGAKPEIAAVVTASGDARRGEELFSSLGCAACHPISGGGKASPARSLEQIFGVDWTLAGCAGAKPGRGPRYELNAEESAALREVQLYGLAPLSRRDAAELSRRSVRELRCGACHDRDGVESLAARLERAGERGAPELSPPPGEDDGGNEDSSPLPAALKFRPSLTFAGEQLRTDWLQKLFAGRLGYRV
ncbi:MAG TPA: PA14 domain-containing protein, partial [Planctomycetota bacterium]|nr:PA14 domain-containing protein [Planctomycetota bacterium]